MSHFVILVIGENIDKQLEKYSEELEMPEYIREEVSDDDKQSFLDYYRKNEGLDETVSFEDAYALHGESWNGMNWRKNANGVWCEYTTYNPNSKWDWYIIGGRWTGFLKVKEGTDIVLGQSGVFGNQPEQGYADQCYKRDLDLEGQRQDAVEKALKNWYKIEDAFGGEGSIPIIEKSWDEFMAEIQDPNNPMDINRAREEYHNQDALLAVTRVRNAQIEALKAEHREANAEQIADNLYQMVELGKRLTAIVGDSVLSNGTIVDEQLKKHIDNQEVMDIVSEYRKLDNFNNTYNHDALTINHFFDLADYQGTREQYIERAYNDAMTPYAFVKDGKWYERGKMGWFGMASNEKDPKDWAKEFNEMLDALPEDTLITTVDCHI